MSRPGHADIVLSAAATVEKPDLPSYQATIQQNNTWYADVLFKTSTSYVRATGGTPHTGVNITWSIQIGEGPSNDNMGIAAQAYGFEAAFDADGRWEVKPSLSGSLIVLLGDRTARTIARAEIPNTQNSAQAVATKGFTVVAPQGGGGGGGA